MRSKAAFAVLSGAFLFNGGVLPAFEGARVTPVAIYGEDDRREAVDSTELRRALSDSVPAIVRGDSLSWDKKTDYYEIKLPMRLEDSFVLAPGQKFAGQITMANASGALVGDDLLITSGHLFKPGRFDCAGDKVVFGYSMGPGSGAAPLRFPARDVYSCKKVIFFRIGSKKQADFAVIRLDRKVAGRTPLAINRAGGLKAGTEVFIAGYPLGLPAKVAGNAKVREAPADAPFFVMNADAFQGNSGGPVFNAATMRIEGIVSGGAEDIVFTPSGGVYAVYPQDGGDGEYATKISEAKELLPVTKLERYLDFREQTIDRQRSAGRPEPAVIFPGSGGAMVQPAVYYPEPKPAAVPIR